LRFASFSTVGQLAERKRVLGAGEDKKGRRDNKRVMTSGDAFPRHMARPTTKEKGSIVIAGAEGKI